MVNERITIRLDEKSVMRADSFIASTEKYSNRSELIRTAINTLIAKETGKDLSEFDVRVSLNPKAMSSIDFMVAHGRFDSRSQACAELVKKAIFDLDMEHVMKSGLAVSDVDALVTKLKKLETENVVEYQSR